jgi:hypothetical protein
MSAESLGFLSMIRNVSDVDARVGHTVRGAQDRRSDRHRAFRYGVQGLLARRRRRQSAQHELPEGRTDFGAIQERGVDVSQDAARKRDLVHGSLHAASEVGHRDQSEQRHDVVHAHTFEEGQIQHEQNDNRRPTDLPSKRGYTGCNQNSRKYFKP